MSCVRYIECERAVRPKTEKATVPVAWTQGIEYRAGSFAHAGRKSIVSQRERNVEYTEGGGRSDAAPRPWLGRTTGDGLKEIESLKGNEGFTESGTSHLARLIYFPGLKLALDVMGSGHWVGS
ncbi:hypothetical protein B0H14DRAFT_2607538 [Mycena olivaceomarginata]|nr:hypothetical protein B0H14DRAFT_2607538 [Mycena olivaceomarginata]